MLWIERPPLYDNYTATTNNDKELWHTAFHAFFWLVDSGTMKLSFVTTNYCFAGRKKYFNFAENSSTFQTLVHQTSSNYFEPFLPQLVLTFDRCSHDPSKTASCLPEISVYPSKKHLCWAAMMAYLQAPPRRKDQLPRQVRSHAARSTTWWNRKMPWAQGGWHHALGISHDLVRAKWRWLSPKSDIDMARNKQTV